MYKFEPRVWGHRVRKTVILSLTVPLLSVMPQSEVAYAATAQASDGYCSQTFTGSSDVTVIHDGNSCVVIFKATAANATTNYSWTVSSNASSVSILVVGGGGSGGVRHGAGGGAGGYVSRTGVAVTPNGTVSISVGAGGASVSGGASSNGNAGTASSFSSYSAAGGGFGGQTSAGGSGGSGGGGCCSSAAGSGNTPALTPSQGNNGGVGTRGNNEYNWSGGGGGGAGSVGGSSTSTSSIGGVGDYTTTGTVTGGAGGNGVTNNITGTSICYAAGGGGAVAASGANAGDGGRCGATTSGGKGGKGANNTSPNYLPQQGVDATGSGGGGGGFEGGSQAASGRGGSGIVVVRYDLPTITFSANNGTGAASSTSLAVTSNGTITLPTKNTLARTGFEFSGWNTAEDGRGTNYAVGATLTPSANMTLYAQWNSTITYNGNTATSTRTIETTTAYSSAANSTLSNGRLLSGTPISSGLVLSLDAADSSTVSGSTWRNKVAGVSGAEASATIVGSPTYNSTEGYFALNGSSQYFTLGTTNYYFNGTKNFSLGICYSTSDVNKSAALISRYNGGIAGTYLFYQYAGFLYGNREVSPWGTSAGSRMVAGDNYCASYTYDGSYVRVYINGVLDATSALITGSVYDSTITAAIGAAYDSNVASRFLKGKIYNAQIYNRALSASEIATNYQSMAPVQKVSKTNYTLGSWNTAADSTGTSYGAAGYDLSALPTPYFRVSAENYSGGTLSASVGASNLSITKTGTPTLNANSGGGYGANARFATISGGTGDGFRLGNSEIPNYTFCGMARYMNLPTGATGTQGRIFSYGSGTNWLSGWYNGSTKDFFHNAWLLDSTTLDQQWHVVCDVGNEIYWDGVKLGVTYQSYTNLPPLAINWTVSGDNSNYEFTEAIVYNEALSQAQIAQLFRYFKNKFGLTDVVTTAQTANALIPPTNYASSGDATLYASWASQVTYDGNKQTTGVAPSPQSITSAGGTAAAAGTLARAGYRFAGWNTAADGSGTRYLAGAALTNDGNKTLFAQWVLPVALPVSVNNPSALSPYMRLVASDYDAVNKIWRDSSGNSRNVTRISGAPTVVTTTGNGATKSFQTVAGGTSDKIYFDNAPISTNWTVFALSRYSGASNRNRIISGNYTSAAYQDSSGNWLFGQYNGKSSVAHYNGWVSPDSTPAGQTVTDWLVSTAYPSNYRYNGTPRGTSGGTAELPPLGINTFEGQLSDYQVAEVIIYNRTLTASEIGQVEDYFDETYGLPYAKVGTYQTASTLAIAATIGGRSDTFTSTYGLGNKTFTISPTVSGISLDTSTANGVVVTVGSLVPTGVYVETITATDQAGFTAQHVVTITVSEPIRWSASNATTLTTTVGKAVSSRMTITGGMSGRLASITKPTSVPLGGITIDTSTLVSSGYVTLNVSSAVLPGTYTLGLSITDDTKRVSNQSVTLVVNNLPSLTFTQGVSDTTTTVTKDGLWLQYEIGKSWAGVGTLVTDLTGNNDAAGITTGSVYSPTFGGGSVTLSGTKLIWLNTGLISNTDSLSKFYWIYPTAATGTIVTTCTSGCPYHESEFEMLNGTLYARVWNLNSVASTETITINAWHYVGYIYDRTGGYTYIYIDGRLAGSVANSGTRGSPGNATQYDGISIGDSQNMVTSANGQFSFGGAHYYKRVLTAAEVFSNFAATAPRYYGISSPGQSVSGSASITTTQGVSSSYSLFTATSGTGNKVLTLSPTSSGVSLDTSTANLAILNIANTVTATNSTTAKVITTSVVATDSATAQTAYNLSITVNPPIIITPTIASTVTTTFGVAAYDTFTATYGTGTYAFTNTASSNQSAFTLTKPSANVGLLTIASNLPAGTYTDTITVTDSVSAVTNYVLTVVVNPRITISGAVSTSVSTTIGKAASIRINVINGTGARTLAYTSPHAGITIDSSTIASNYATLNVSTSTPANTFTFAVTARDSLGISSTETFTVVVNKAPKITGPSVVTNGLELNFDAGNASSYSGTGTTWNSTVGGKSVTLLGTSGLPTYSSNSGGLIDFNATDLATQKHYAAGSIANTTLTSYTVEAWAKFASLPTGEINALVSDKYRANINYELFYGSINVENCGGTAGLHISHFDATTGWKCSKTITGIAINTWYHIVGTYDSTAGFRLYLNGVLQSSATSAITGNAPSDSSSREIYIAKRHDASTQFFPGSIPVVRVYNRALTAAEALQNYNAIAYRYVNAASGNDSITVTSGRAASITGVLATDGTGDKTFTISGLNSGVSISSPAVNQFTLALSENLTSVDSVTARTIYETVTATDASAATTTFTYKITVNPPIRVAVTANSLATTSGIVAYDTFTATYGTGNKTFTLTGSPTTSGFSITQANNVAVLKVEATANPGTYYETVTATDSLGAITAMGITVVVSPPPSILGISQIESTKGVASTSPIFSISGGTGALTMSVVKSPTNSNITLTGVTSSGGYLLIGSASETGTYLATIRATDSLGSYSELAVTVIVNAPVTLSGSLAITKTYGVSTTNGYSTNGSGTAPFSFSATPVCAVVKTVSGSYTYEKINGTDSCTWTAPVGVSTVDALLVGAGGGGGGDGGAGGGGGSINTLTSVALPANRQLSVQVGAGGTGGTWGGSGAVSGGTTTVSNSSTTYTAPGGAAGGGCGSASAAGGVAGSGGTAVAGGNSGYGATGSGCGGGNGSAGANGPSSSFTGSAINYGGGGGGGPLPNTPTIVGPNAGGAGGGGGGSSSRDFPSYGLLQYFKALSSAPPLASSNQAFTTDTCAVITGNINYTADADFPCSQKDNFQGHATGYFIAPVTGSITFYLSSDDSSDLVINVNGTYKELPLSPCCTTVSATWTGFVEGQAYPIGVYFTEISGLASWKLEYAYTGQTQTVIPMSQLRSNSEGLAQYFRTSASPADATTKPAFTTGTCSQRIGNIAYTTDSDFPCSTKDNFQGYATGYFIAPYTGSIKFYLTSDDSSDLVININGTDNEIARPCCAESSATWSGFVKGQYYPISVYFTENTGGAVWKLEYEYTGQARTYIPVGNLRSTNSFTNPVRGTNGLGGGGGAGSAGLFKITGAQGGSGTAIIKYLTPSETATETMITALVNQESPSGLLTLNVPAKVNVGVYTETITVQDAANSAPYQAVVTITINKATPTVALSLPGAVTTAKYGNPVTISAAASTAGNVLFKYGNTGITACSAVATSAGIATCSWTPSAIGAVTLKATLTPTDTTNYNNSNETSFSVTVGKADTLTVTASNESLTYTGSTALVTKPFTTSGLVSIDSLTAISMIYSGTANDGTSYSSSTAPTLAGTYVATPDTATAGISTISGNYIGVTTVAGTFTLNRAQNTSSLVYPTVNTNSAVTSPPANNYITFKTGVTDTATTKSRLGNGAISYSSLTSSTCSVDSSTALMSVIQAGSCIVKMTVAEGNNYLADSATATIEIAKGNRTIALTSATSTLKYSDTATVTTTISDGALDGNITYSLNASPGCTFDSLGGILTATSGTLACTLNATVAEGTNFLTTSTTSALALTIAKANAPVITMDTVTAVSYVPGQRASIIPTYSFKGFKGTDAASSLTLTYGFVSNPFESFSYSDTQTPIDAGTYSITPSAIVMSSGLATNYETPNYASSAITFTINRIAQDPITIDGINGEVSVPFTLVYRGGNNPTATATFTKVSGAACTVTGNGLNATAAGTCGVTVTVPANRNYLAITSDTITVRVRSYVIVPVFIFGNGTTGITIATTTTLTKGDERCSSGCTPTITAISPYEGSEGDLITLTGTNFTDAVRVIFNVFTNAGTFSVDSDTQITVQIPAGLTIGDGTIEVVTPGGTTPRWFDFGVLP